MCLTATSLPYLGAIIGKEGPLVHLASILEDQLSKRIGMFHKLRKVSSFNAIHHQPLESSHDATAAGCCMRNRSCVEFRDSVWWSFVQYRSNFNVCKSFCCIWQTIVITLSGIIITRLSQLCLGVWRFCGCGTCSVITVCSTEDVPNIPSSWCYLRPWISGARILPTAHYDMAILRPRCSWYAIDYLSD